MCSTACVVAVAVALYAALFALDEYEQLGGGTVRGFDAHDAVGEFAPLPYGRTHFVRGGGGAGASSAPLVLLIHGVSTPAVYAWRELAPLLHARGFRTLAFDLYGRGWSDAPGGGAAMTAEFFAAQAAALLVHANETAAAVHVVGLSLGGPVAVAFARAYASRVATLTLIAPAGMPRPRDAPKVALARYARGVAVAATRLSLPRAMTQFARQAYSTRADWSDVPLDSAALNDARRLAARYATDSPAFARTLVNTLAHYEFDARRSYAALAGAGVSASRVQFVWGDADQAVPFAGAALGALVGDGARVHVIERGSHAVVLTHASRVAELMLPLLLEH